MSNVNFDKIHFVVKSLNCALIVHKKQGKRTYLATHSSIRVHK